MSNIVLKDRNGNKNTYSGIDVINIADSDGIYNRYVAEPKEEIEITSNGIFDVKSAAKAKVNVPSESVPEWNISDHTITGGDE